METTEKINSKEVIYNAYQSYCLKEGSEPNSTFVLADYMSCEESEIMKHFTTVRVIEKSLWESMAIELREVLKKDKAYSGYSAREQLLSVYFTIVEVYKQRRSFVAWRFSQIKPELPWFLDNFKDHIEDEFKAIVAKGIEQEEFVSRPFVSNHYYKGAWMNLLYITRVWSKDESEEFQTTDAAIEKSTALLCECYQKGFADTLIDFAKFAFQQKAW